MLNEIDKKILRILLEEKEPVSSKGLALRCGVSINTIRKEIGLINEEVEAHGLRIGSRTAVGHYLEIFDKQRADPWLSRIRYLYQRNQFFPREYSEEVAWLARRCLCAGGWVTVEEVSQELYCSHSTVLRYMDRVRSILEKYECTLVNKRGYGFYVKGNEWNIRQCLLYQHKIYNLEIGEKEHKEYTFKSTFFMGEGISRYEQVRQVLLRCLKEQQDFWLPFMDVPKIVNYILLIASRSRRASGYAFTGDQIARAGSTAEYAFVKKMQAELPQRFREAFHEEDSLALAMLLLSFETQNAHLKEMDEYAAYEAETRELIAYLCRGWEYPEELFDGIFMEDCICLLYTLHNRRFFHVYHDGESLEFVRHKGIRTADICICFARFYEEKHGISLTRQETLGVFYLFHRVVKRDRYCYYSQNILIISRYGIQYARSLAERIRQSYGYEVSRVSAREFCDVRDEDFLEYDLLLTDINPERVSEWTPYRFPTLQVAFGIGQRSCPELDRYLARICVEDGVALLREGGFRRMELKDKEDVFRCAAELMSEDEGERPALIRHMRENDGYTDLERGNGIVLLPVMMERMSSAQIMVLIAKTEFRWNENYAQVFVCYSRIPSGRMNQVINNVLKRFVHIPAEKAEELVFHPEADPLQILYPDKEESR